MVVVLLVVVLLVVVLLVVVLLLVIVLLVILNPDAPVAAVVLVFVLGLLVVVLVLVVMLVVMLDVVLVVMLVAWCWWRALLSATSSGSASPSFPPLASPRIGTSSCKRSSDAARSEESAFGSLDDRPACNESLGTASASRMLSSTAIANHTCHKCPHAAGCCELDTKRSSLSGSNGTSLSKSSDAKEKLKGIC